MLTFTNNTLKWETTTANEEIENLNIQLVEKQSQLDNTITEYDNRIANMNNAHIIEIENLNDNLKKWVDDKELEVENAFSDDFVQIEEEKSKIEWRLFNTNKKLLIEEKQNIKNKWVISELNTRLLNASNHNNNSTAS